MTTIVTRSGKGSALTNTEIDTNFTNLDSFKVEQTAATGAAIIPSGTEAQRPGSPVAGHLRFNDDTDTFEGYNGTEWGSIGGGVVGVESPDPSTVAQRDANADLYANNFVSASDRILKENIIPISGALDKIKKLQGVTFNWKKNPEYGLNYGFIAQDVEEVIPEIVKESSEQNLSTGEAAKIKTVNYPVLVSILTEAIKELEDRINSLEAK